MAQSKVLKGSSLKIVIDVFVEKLIRNSNNNEILSILFNRPTAILGMNNCSWRNLRVIVKRLNND